MLLIGARQIVQIDVILIAGTLFFLGVFILVTDDWEAYNVIPTQKGGVSLATSFITPFGLSAILGLCGRITAARVFLGFGPSQNALKAPFS